MFCKMSIKLYNIIFIRQNLTVEVFWIERKD